MLDNFAQPRALIDAFEACLVNAFAPLPIVDAIWVRDAPEMMVVHRKTFCRRVWLQLARTPSTWAVNALARLGHELVDRSMNEPFSLEVQWVVDELPPADVLPACIYRRGSARG